MRAAKLASDALWQCLCPSWTLPLRDTSLRLIRPISQKRSFTSTRAHNVFGLQPPQAYVRLDRTAVQETLTYAEDDVRTLYDRLKVSSRRGRQQECRDIAKYLVQQRGEAPNVRIYDSLIACNINAEHGAAWRVYDILAEMESLKIELDIAICHTILKVLAVHPDHLLRDDILHHMRSRWFTINERGHQDIVVGYLREGCFEMAIEAMEKMRQRDMPLPAWLSDMTVYMLADANELDTVYQMMKRRWNSGEQSSNKDGAYGISDSLWHWLLDKASDARHYPMAEFVWRVRVQTGKLQASTGMCYNIMSTAARAGDPALATQVVGYITKRGEKVTPLHFQLLADSYMGMTEPDLEKALDVLVVMSLERIPATQWHTRSIYTHIKDSPSLLKDAFDKLQYARDQGKSVPVAAVNVIIEAYCEQRDLQGAMHVFKQLHSFTSNGKALVNRATFVHLFRLCRRVDFPNVEQAEFLVTEMYASGVEPDAVIFHHLIKAFLDAAAHASVATDHDSRRRYAERALFYLRRNMDAGIRPRFNDIDDLASCLASLGDDRCWIVLQIASDVRDETWDVRLSDVRHKINTILRQRFPYDLRGGIFDRDERLGDVARA